MTLAALAAHRPPPGVSYSQVLTDQGQFEVRTASRCLAGVLLGLVTILVVTPLVTQLVLFVGWNAIGRQGSFADFYAAGTAYEFPLGMFASHLGLAVLLPTALGLMVVVHQLSPRWLHSVQPGFRWRYGLGALLIGVVVTNLVLFVTGAGWTWQLHPQPDFGWFLLVILIMSPLQAAAEEYFFRGYLLQSLQATLRLPWAGVVASAFVFALFHGTQNLPLFLDRFGFGLLAGLLVSRTGGLEAAIAAHVANNVFAFVWAGLTSSIATVKATQVIGWWNLATDLGRFALFAVAAVWLAGRMQLATRTPG